MKTIHNSIERISVNKINVLASLLASLLFMPGIVIANQFEALKYYQHGETALNAGNYDKAIEYMNKAIAIRGEDGAIIVEERITTTFLPRGRTVEKQQNIDQLTKAYFPNKRITEIHQLKAEQYRESHPPKLQLKWVSLHDPTGNNQFDGGETSSIAVELENIGESSALNVSLITNLDDIRGLEFDKTLQIGNIKPGQSIIKKIEFRVDKNVPDVSRLVSLKALENSGFNSNALEVFVQSKPHQAEKIIVTNLLIEDLSGDSRIEPSEMVEINATISNIGKGVSGDLIAQLELGENVYLPPDEKGTISLGTLLPGESSRVAFSFLTNRKFVNKQRIPVTLKIIDQSGNRLALSDPGLNIYVPNKPVVVRVIPKEKKISLPDSPLVDVDIQIPVSTESRPNSIAVIIGNRNYRRQGVPRVEYAHNDSRIMKEYLVKTLGFDENNILYYEDATTANFTELFGSGNSHYGRLSNMMRNDDAELFIYYSGHGAPDLKTRNSYFVPVDADPNYIALSGYSLDLFYKNIAKIPSKNVTIVLDTCFSGNSDGGPLLGSISPAIINIKETKPQLKNATVFSSTEIDQVSVWYHEKKHGLFTYFFLKGLAGAADGNKDSIVTSSELGAFVKNTVPYQARRINGIEQNPMLMQTREINFVELPKNILFTQDSAF